MPSVIMVQPFKMNTAESLTGSLQRCFKKKTYVMPVRKSRMQNLKSESYILKICSKTEKKKNPTKSQSDFMHKKENSECFFILLILFLHLPQMKQELFPLSPDINGTQALTNPSITETESPPMIPPPRGNYAPKVTTAINLAPILPGVFQQAFF